MSKGFIPIRRTLFEHFLFNEHRVFSRFEAWLDLIQLASFMDGQTDLIKGKTIIRNRGEVVASIRWIANRWNWSIHKTCDYIEVLRSQDMVVVGKENGITRLSLVNFEKHNSIRSDEKDSKGNSKRDSQSHNSGESQGNEGTVKGTQKGTNGEQSGDSEGTNIKKGNKLKEENKGEDGAGAPPPPGDVKLKERQEKMIQRRNEFYKLLAPYVGRYPKEMLRAFFEKWTEPNVSKTKMKFELETTWDLAGRLTTWENNDLKWGKGPRASDPPAKKVDPGMPKIQQEINYLYGRFLEDQITVISVDWLHFNEIAKAELIILTPDEIESLRAQSKAYLKEKGTPETEDAVTKHAKRFGVLEFFERLKNQGKETVFHDPTATN